MKLQTKPLKDLKLPSATLGFDIRRDGRTAYAACLDGGVYEVDVESGEHRELGRHESYASGVVVIHDEIIVSAGYDGRLQWHDGAGRKVREVEAHRFWSWQLAASPVGDLIASSTGQYLCGGYKYEPAPETEPSVKVYDVLSGDLVHAFSHQPPVLSVEFSPDGKYLAAGNLMGETRVFDLESGKEIARWQTPNFTGWGIIKGHYYTGGIFSIAFTPDGSEILLAGMGSTRDPAAGNGRQLWQRFDWRQKDAPRVDETHSGESGQGLMETIRFHPAGHHFVMAGRVHKGEWNAAFFDSGSGTRLQSLSTKHRVTKAVYSSDGSKLFLAGALSQGGKKDGKWKEFGRVNIFEIEESEV